MPRTSEIRTGALEDLASQLRFAPGSTILRQVEKIEALAREIEPGALYPEDFLIYKVTGYRPPMGEPAMIVGGALLADLSALAERITSGGRLTVEHHDSRDSLGLDELCARWGVSRKTVERYRRLGLVGRRLRRADGKEVLRFSRATVERLERAHPGLIEGAGAFERVSDGDGARMIERARELAGEDGATASSVAARLAGEFGRSRETVRQHILGAEPPVFESRVSVTRSDREAIAERLALGARVRELAEEYGRTEASVRRIDRAVRVARVREAAAGVVRVAGARDGAGACPPGGVERTVGDFARAARRDPPFEAARERALALAYHASVGRADELVSSSRVRAEDLDEAETCLRRAVWVKRAIVRASRRLVLSSIEERAGCAMEMIHPKDAVRLRRVGMAALAGAVDRFDPTKGGRLAARAGLELSRALVKLGAVREGDGAGAALADWSEVLIAHQGALLPGAVVDTIAGVEDEVARSLLERRYGVVDGVARTVGELAEMEGVSRLAMVRRVGGAVRVCAAS